MKVVQLPYGTYDVDIKFLMGTYDEVYRYMWRKHEVALPEDLCGRFWYIDAENPRAYAHRYIIIVTDRCKNKAEHERILIHEIVHCACHVFERRGIKYSSKHNEPLAYYIEWLFVECKGAMKK